MKGKLVNFYFREEDKELYFDCWMQEGYLATSDAIISIYDILKLEGGVYCASGMLERLAAEE